MEIAPAAALCEVRHFADIQRGLLNLTDHNLESFLGWAEHSLSSADHLFLVRTILKSALFARGSFPFL